MLSAWILGFVLESGWAHESAQLEASACARYLNGPEGMLLSSKAANSLRKSGGRELVFDTPGDELDTVQAAALGFGEVIGIPRSQLRVQVATGQLSVMLFARADGARARAVELSWSQAMRAISLRDSGPRELTERIVHLLPYHPNRHRFVFLLPPAPVSTIRVRGAPMSGDRCAHR